MSLSTDRHLDFSSSSSLCPINTAGVTMSPSQFDAAPVINSPSPHGCSEESDGALIAAIKEAVESEAGVELIDRLLESNPKSRSTSTVPISGIQEPPRRPPPPPPPLSAEERNQSCSLSPDRIPALPSAVYPSCFLRSVPMVTSEPAGPVSASIAAIQARITSAKQLASFEPSRTVVDRTYSRGYSPSPLRPPPQSPQADSPCGENPDTAREPFASQPPPTKTARSRAELALLEPDEITFGGDAFNPTSVADVSSESSSETDTSDMSTTTDSSSSSSSTEVQCARRGAALRRHNVVTPREDEIASRCQRHHERLQARAVAKQDRVRLANAKEQHAQQPSDKAPTERRVNFADNSRRRLVPVRRTLRPSNPNCIAPVIKRDDFQRLLRGEASDPSPTCSKQEPEVLLPPPPPKVKPSGWCC